MNQMPMMNGPMMPMQMPMNGMMPMMAACTA